MLAHAKSWLVGLMFLGVAALSSAHASPELARDWGLQADKLYKELSLLRSQIEAAPAGNVDMPYETRADLMRFASSADQLAVAIDKTEGPKDLRCIFRGMSEEVGVQLDGFDTDSDTRMRYAAVVRLQKAADDARAVSMAAVSVLSGTQTGAHRVTGACKGEVAQMAAR